MNTIVARRDHKINGWTDVLQQALTESSNLHFNEGNLTKRVLNAGPNTSRYGGSIPRG